MRVNQWRSQYACPMCTSRDMRVITGMIKNKKIKKYTISNYKIEKSHKICAASRV